jgi:uroporphyrinogen-III synthase
MLDKDYTVVITRTLQKSLEFSEKIKSIGFPTEIIPSIEVIPRQLSREEQEIIIRLQLGGFDWLLLTSPNGVSTLKKALLKFGKKNTVLLRNDQLIAVQGEGTLERLIQEFNRKPDLIPDTFVGEGLMDSFDSLEIRESSVLFAGSSKSRGVVQKYLIERGADVVSLDIYDTKSLAIDSEVVLELAEKNPKNLIFIFFSPSAFESTLKSFGSNRTVLASSNIVSIGPVTTRAINKHGEEGILEVLKEKFS